jgi:hypothetical protein
MEVIFGFFNGKGLNNFGVIEGGYLAIFREDFKITSFFDELMLLELLVERF